MADALIGGWQITGEFTFTSGDYPRFGNLIVTGNPCQNVPSGYYFNPSAFSVLPANTYVLRTNPLQYSCIIGPSFMDLDATLQKNFHITERVQAQLKMTAYNATNKLNLWRPGHQSHRSEFRPGAVSGLSGGRVRRPDRSLRQPGRTPDRTRFQTDFLTGSPFEGMHLLSRRGALRLLTLSGGEVVRASELRLLRIKAWRHAA